MYARVKESWYHLIILFTIESSKILEEISVYWIATYLFQILAFLVLVK